MHTDRQSALIISMPYAGIIIPSIQLPVLETYARQNDIHIETRHLYLKAAQIYGLANYHTLIYPPSDSYTAQLAYTQYLFPNHWKENLTKIKDYYNTIIPEDRLPFTEYLQYTDEFYYWILDHLDWKSYDLIGFTLNYGQLLPSLAIAKHIKEYDPEKKIILGGSRTVNDLGKGVLQAFPFIDYIVSGDGEDALVKLAKNPDNLTSIPGLTFRTPNKIQTNTVQEIDLATAPIPSFDQFYKDLHNSTPEIQQFCYYNGRLPIEITRGCWWNHCTFCNLNIQHRHYREKPIPNIIKELQYHTDRYQTLDYQLIGNTLPKHSYRELFQALKNLNKDYTFFVEARAGQLTSHDYQLMHEAGFTMIQTGIESLSDHYLKTMNKGTRVIDNIAAIKFCRQYNIQNGYNLIVNYPNETITDYEETKNIIQKLKAYLDPPQYCNLRVMHGSPIHQHPQQYNISNLHPITIDTLIYPQEILQNNFTFVYGYTTTTPAPNHDWRTLIQDWKTTRDKLQGNSYLTNSTIDHLIFYSADGGSFMKIYDKRDPTHIRILKLNTLERDVLLACTDIISYKDLQNHLPAIPEFKLAAILQSFEHAGIVYRENDHYLSLPLQYQPKTNQDTHAESLPITLTNS